MMRIAQIAPLWTRVPPDNYGGTELRVHWLSEGLAARGHDVTLYASGDSVFSRNLKTVVGTNLVELMGRGAAHSYDHYANVLFAKALADSVEYDLLHVHLDVAQMAFARLSTAPVVCSFRTMLSTDDYWLVSESSSVTFVAMSQSQIRYAPEPLRHRIPVIYNGCNFASYHLSCEPRQYLVFLGRMAAHKNPLDAIRIAKAARMPIVLAGLPMNSKEEAFFKEEVRPLIDDVEVRYVGPVNQDQKRELLSGAAALLFPITWDEPFGNVMIEALASGTPVLAYGNGSVPEVVDQGVTGFYGSGMEELVELLPATLALDHAAVRSHAFVRFGHERMVSDYLGLFKRVMEGHGGSTDATHGTQESG